MKFEMLYIFSFLVIPVSFDIGIFPGTWRPPDRRSLEQMKNVTILVEDLTMCYIFSMNHDLKNNFKTSFRFRWTPDCQCSARHGKYSTVTNCRKISYLSSGSGPGGLQMNSEQKNIHLLNY